MNFEENALCTAGGQPGVSLPCLEGPRVSGAGCGRGSQPCLAPRCQYRDLIGSQGLMALLSPLVELML